MILIITLKNDWIYAHLSQAATRMIRLAAAYPDAHGPFERALNQAARELMLAQASDWAFIMRSNTTVDYAIHRTETHLRRFCKLADQIESKTVDTSWLDQVGQIDNLFPRLDYRVYANRSPVKKPSDLSSACH